MSGGAGRWKCVAGGGEYLGDDGGWAGPIAVRMWEASDSIGDLD